MEITVSASGKINDIITNLNPDLDEPTPQSSRVITIEDQDDQNDLCKPGSIGVNRATALSEIEDISDTEPPQVTLPTPAAIITGKNCDMIGVNTAKAVELVEIQSSEELDSTVIYGVPDEYKLSYPDTVDRMVCQKSGDRFMEHYSTASGDLLRALHDSTEERKVVIAVNKLKTSEIKRWIQKPETKPKTKPKISLP